MNGSARPAAATPPRVSPAAPVRPDGGPGDSHDDARPGLRAADRIGLLLLFLSSGAITGLALGGNILLAMAVFGAIICGGIVGWFLHSFLAESRTVRGGSACAGLSDERRT